MKKTLTFAVLHFSVASLIAYLLTGDILLSSLIAMIEPMANTVAFYFHELVWQHWARLQPLKSSPCIKTGSFAVIHFSVAFLVAYLLSGSWFVGGVMAAIEPSVNTVVFYFHERVWIWYEVHHRHI